MKIKHHIFLLFLIVELVQQLISFSAFSQAPKFMGYQSIIRNYEGELVIEKQVGIRIQIKQGFEFGAAVYIETHNSTTSKTGLVSIEIGRGSKVFGSIDSIDWSNGPYYLYCEIDPEGGSRYDVWTMSQILSVPYSFYANTAENVPGFASQDYVNNLKAQIDELQSLARLYDIEGNAYKIVKIGKQFWMAENLRTTKYNDGTSIPLVTDNSNWVQLATPAYCWYDNNEKKYKNPYGALYNGYAANTDKLCPAKWHVPGIADWDTLINYLGGIYVASGKLRESDITHWRPPNIGATNESGFTALPGCYRDNSFGEFKEQIGDFGLYWSSSELNNYNNYYISLDAYINEVFRYDDQINLGISIRCIKDR